MTPDPTETADVLDRAADLLERDGWQRFTFGSFDPDKHECRCVAAAIGAAAHGYDDSVGACNALRDHLRVDDLFRWNDHDAKDANYVRAALRRTARKLRGASR